DAAITAGLCHHPVKGLLASVMHQIGDLGNLSAGQGGEPGPDSAHDPDGHHTVPDAELPRLHPELVEAEYLVAGKSGNPLVILDCHESSLYECVPSINSREFDGSVSADN